MVYSKWGTLRTKRNVPPLPLPKTPQPIKQKNLQITFTNKIVVVVVGGGVIVFIGSLTYV